MNNKNIPYQYNDSSFSEVLVDTSWIENNIGKEDVKIIEVDYDPNVNYGINHIPGSVLIRWKEDLNNSIIRDILNRNQFQNLLKNLGISQILYCQIVLKSRWMFIFFDRIVSF